MNINGQNQHITSLNLFNRNKLGSVNSLDDSERAMVGKLLSEIHKSCSRRGSHQQLDRLIGVYRSCSAGQAREMRKCIKHEISSNIFHAQLSMVDRYMSPLCKDVIDDGIHQITSQLTKQSVWDMEDIVMGAIKRASARSIHHPQWVNLQSIEGRQWENRLNNLVADERNTLSNQLGEIASRCYRSDFHQRVEEYQNEPNHNIKLAILSAIEDVFPVDKRSFIDNYISSRGKKAFYLALEDIIMQVIEDNENDGEINPFRPYIQKYPLLMERLNDDSLLRLNKLKIDERKEVCGQLENLAQKMSRSKFQRIFYNVKINPKAITEQRKKELLQNLFSDIKQGNKKNGYSTQILDAIDSGAIDIVDYVDRQVENKIDLQKNNS